MTPGEGLNGIQKAAILLVGLGPEASVEVFKQLSESEIDKLTMEISNTRQLRNKETEQVLDEFYDMILAQDYMSEGGLDYARSILEQALGRERAMDTIGRLTNRLQVKPFSFIKSASPSQIVNILQHEHAQTIALVLSHLDSLQSSEILSQLPASKQVEVARRIALLESTSPEVIHQIEQVLERKLSASGAQHYTSTGGVDAIVKVLGKVNRSTEKTILSELEIENPELVKEIKKRLFVFEDIVNLDAKSIQRVIREVNDSDLTYALKVMNDEVKEAIFNNISQRRGEALQEEISLMGPVKLKDVEKSQENIVAVIRDLEEQGEIVIARGEGEDVVV